MREETPLEPVSRAHLPQPPNDALGDTEAKLRTLVEHIPQKIFVKDRSSRYLFVNERYARDLGLKPEEAIGRDDYEFFSRDLAAKYQADDRRVMESGQTEEIEEQYLQDGQRIWIHITKAPVRRSDGSVIGVFGIFRDITEKREAQVGLRRHVHILDAVCFAAEAFLKISDWRESMTEVLKRLGEAAKVSRAVLFEARPDDDGEVFLSLSAEWARPPLVPRTGDPRLESFSAAASGFQRWTANLTLGEVIQGLVRELPPSEQAQLASHGIQSIVVVPVFVGGKWWGFLAFDECTAERTWKPEEVAALRAAANILGEAIHRRQAEESLRQVTQQLEQAQRLEAIGQLAGGVAHDFNNILAATILNLDLLRQTAVFDEESRKSLDELDSDIRRAANLTRQLLLFGRRSIMRIQRLDLDHVVENLLKMLRRLIGEHITLEWHNSSVLPALSGDPGMLEQVLVNLVVNARDAMPQGGRITLETVVTVLDDEAARAHPDARPGRYVRITVNDTGCGMDDTVLRHIFEPFFTTKEPGRGTGLGLATVYSIARQHKGWVTVESQVGRGSQFHVFLPTLPDPLPATSPPAPAQHIPGGQESILLVEDEASLRRSIANFLRLRGYRVLEAADAPEALRLWAEHQENFDLLYSDMIMPHGVTGLQLAEQMRASKPNLKVLISSGYSAELAQPVDLASQRIHFLAKPFDPPSLAVMVRRCFETES